MRQSDSPKVLQTQKILGQIVQASDLPSLLNVSNGDILPLKAVDHPLGSIVEAQVENGQIHTLKLLAPSGSVTASIYEIVGRYKLEPYFSGEIATEVTAILANTGIDDPSLTNYEDKAFCTIDGTNTRDLDQALFIDKDGQHLVVYYALADAAYYVRPGSALFKETLKRGASYYLPGLMIPMLPRELCEGVVSLNPGVNRRAVVFELTLDAAGRHVKTHITRARIRSRAKLSFDAVQAYFDDPGQSPLTQSELNKSLLRLKKVGLLRLQLAEERKVARYHRTEINVEIGENGLVFNIMDNVRNAVELYNEQLSLLCNTEGAKILAAQADLDPKTQAIYKVHAPPPEDKLTHFEHVLTDLIKLHRLSPQKWLWDQRNPAALSDYLQALPTEGAQARIAQAINRQALMTNNRSQFSDHADPHYGVGAEVYTRFSAPMREMAGIFLHKELLEKIGYQAQLMPVEQERALRDQIILAANRAKDLQSELTKAANELVMDQLFNADLDYPEAERPRRLGTVIGLKADKLYILLDNPAIEVKIYVEDLQRLWNTPLTVDQNQISLYQNQERIISLGDGVQLTVIEKSSHQEHWVFQLQLA